MERAKIIFGLLAMVFGAFVVWQMNDIRNKAEVAPSWPHVIGSITTSELDFENDAKIRYRYDVNGRAYESWKLFHGMVSNGDIFLEDGATLSDGGLVARFPAGSEVKVYYDPENPSDAILLPGAEHKTDLMKFIFGYGFVAGGLLLTASAFLAKRRRGSVDIGKLVFRLLLGGGMLAVGVGIVWFMSDIRTENRMARFWPSVTGKVTLAEVWGDRPEIAYEYSVDGGSYLSDQLYIGVPTKRLTLDDGTELWPRRLNRRFRLGEPVEVFVDPDDPTNAILLPDAKHNTDVPIYLGYAFAIFGPLIALFGKMGGRGSPKNSPNRQRHPESGVTKIKTRRRSHPPKSSRV